MNVVLVGALTLPLLASLSAVLAGRRHPGLVGRFGAAAAAAGLVSALLIAAHVAVDGSISATLRSAQGNLIAGLGANRLSALLLVLVYGVSTVVQVFALRYLAGDRRSGWFTAGTGLLTAASAGLMTSGTLIGLAVSWTLAGIALCLLQATYWELPAARDGVLRTATAFLLGDLALWAAVGLITTQRGNVSLSDLEPAAYHDSSSTLTVTAGLIVVAALSRSAQIPFHRWLPATLAAPTPVSALLHAGVVNAGGVLLVRLSPIVSGSAVAMGLAFTAGTLSMLYGGVVMLTKSDIKGSLVYSTMAQMGFMILTCGLGLSAAAVFHLVGHGFYKATLFLSSGSAIAKRRQKAARPPVPALTSARWAAIHATALLLPAAALYAASSIVRLPHAGHGSAQVLLVFTWATAAAALTGWLARSPGARAAVIGAVALLAAAVGYVALVGAVTGFLAPDLPPVTVPSASTAGIVAIAVILAALTLLPRAPANGWFGRLQRALYAKALVAGHVPASRPQQTPNNQLTGALQ
ncbi:NADH-quinone oxidoreductase subunit L [Mycobacterium attenuatum]|uniref:NADH-quinone oxidoreductase subunit L n=1 Tax=Mycobacterium attenuatum TaxID=2341086 RepID=A0A498QFH9_9MYCO|nr:proton-conducting transporter membrane subunit [Mycobacterium attenuatum]VBA43342.1 NADH-quinone oxidoreductase subunit L [Mycobacterium attenuatum]VBA59451.1 NADH-quinone oxidoreductase subunit L [Mycobacterium attenuatum]